MDRLEEAAKLRVSSYPEKRKHIAGIAFLSIGVMASGVRLERGEVIGAKGSSLQPIVSTRIVKNPSYSGELKLDTSERKSARLRRVDVPLSELHLQPSKDPEHGSKPQKKSPKGN